MAQRFFIETHGCQMNEHDSEKVRGLLGHRGMIPAATLEEADLYVLNTCSIREKAAQKVYSRLGEIGKLKESRPDLTIGVLGCVAQQEGEDMVKRAPYVDFVMGTHLYHSIPDLLDELHEDRASQGRSGAVRTAFLDDKAPVEISEIEPQSSFRANVTIMEGCNKRCAFCIVPFTRGKERNRPSRHILEQARRHLDAGFIEIVLLGQTVNHYKDPEDPRYQFADLLAELAVLPGLERLRFTSPHPRHFGDDVIAVIDENETICNHVHLPLQSGSSRILRRMRRQHDRDWYIELLEKFEGCRRRIALSTDLIVGFPGEEERDFEDTLSLVERARFEQMFSFKYSRRPHTEADGWDDEVPEQEKSRRLMILQRLQREIQLEIHQKRYLGATFEVLCEGEARDGRRRFGRTASNKVVNFFGDQRPGETASVEITEFGPNSLVGEVVTKAGRMAETI